MNVGNFGYLLRLCVSFLCILGTVASLPLDIVKAGGDLRPQQSTGFSGSRGGYGGYYYGRSGRLYPVPPTDSHVIKGENGDVRGAQETLKGDTRIGQYNIQDTDGMFLVTYILDGLVANVESKQGGTVIVAKAVKEGEMVGGSSKPQTTFTTGMEKSK